MFKRQKEVKASNAHREIQTILGPGLPHERTPCKVPYPLYPAADVPTVLAATSSVFAHQLLCLCVHVHVLVLIKYFSSSMELGSTCFINVKSATFIIYPSTNDFF